MASPLEQCYIYALQVVVLEVPSAHVRDDGQDALFAPRARGRPGERDRARSLLRSEVITELLSILVVNVFKMWL